MIADAGYIKLTVIILLFGLLIYLSVVSIREGDEVDVYENPNLGTKYANSGFSFTAFFFSFLWAFVSNLWEIGFYLLAVYVTLSLLGLFMYPIAVLLGLLIHVFIGFKANDWKATSLLTRGYRYQRTLKKQFLRGLSPITDVKRNSKILIRQLITHIKHNIKFEAFSVFKPEEIYGASKQSSLLQKRIGYAITLTGLVSMAVYSAWYYKELYPHISLSDIVLNIILLIFPLLLVIVPGMSLVTNAEIKDAALEILKKYIGTAQAVETNREISY